MAAEDRETKRTAISLFIDDTGIWPHGAVATLLDFCAAQGVRGKLSLIPGRGVKPGQRHVGERKTAEAEAFMSEMASAAERGFDVHMELMTHGNLWDFSVGAMRQDGPHEGIWLFDPDVSVAEYQAYFAGVLDAALAGGVTINGLTVPGCGCDACTARESELQASGHGDISRNAWQALLNLAVAGRFGVPAVAVFVAESDGEDQTRMMASQGGSGVCDARVDILDLFLLDNQDWQLTNVDRFITEDGRRGRIAELVLAGAERCFLCVHWMKMNPATPEGWAAFQEVVRRINATLADRVEWVKPSEYGQRLLEG